MKNAVRMITAYVLSLSLVFLPPQSAHAGERDREYHALCDQLPKDVGDNAKNYCTQAKMAMITKDAEAVKLVVYTTATAAAIYLAIAEAVPYSTMSAKTACKIINISATAIGVGTDVVAATQSGNAAKAMTSALTGALSLAMSLGGGSGLMSLIGKGAGSSLRPPRGNGIALIAYLLLGVSSEAFAQGPGADAGFAGPTSGSAFSGTGAANLGGGNTNAGVNPVNAANQNAVKINTDNTDQLRNTVTGKDPGTTNANPNQLSNNPDGVSGKSPEKGTRLACVMTAVSMGIQAGTSLYSLNASKAAFDAAYNAAKDLLKTSTGTPTPSPTATPNSGGYVGGGATGGGNGGSSGGGTADATATTASDCSSQSGTAFLNCHAAKSPEIAAMTANQPFMNTMNKALGQNLGDFAKGFTGSTAQDAQNYAAGGLGLNPSALAATMGAMDKAAVDAGAYQTMAYASNSTKKSFAADPEMDYSKMMADQLAKLNPDAKKDSKEDPSEQVYRKLDLMSADKINQDKDISLFIRVGFRYRKNINNLEQINWADGTINDGPTQKR